MAMTRFVRATVRNTGDIWTLRFTQWSPLFGEFDEVSVHKSVVGATDALIALRCGVGCVTYTTDCGETVSSLNSLVSGRKAVADPQLAVATSTSTKPRKLLLKKKPAAE